MVLAAVCVPIQVERMFKPKRRRKISKCKEGDLMMSYDNASWDEHVDTLAEVGEVGPLVTQGGSANSDGLLCGTGE